MTETPQHPTPPQPDWWPSNPYYRTGLAREQLQYDAYERALGEAWIAMCSWLSYSGDGHFWKLKDQVARHYGQQATPAEIRARLQETLARVQPALDIVEDAHGQVGEHP